MRADPPKEGELWVYNSGIRTVYKIEKVFCNEQGVKVARLKDVETDFVCEEYGFSAFSVKGSDEKYYWQLFRGQVEPIKTPEPNTKRQVIEI